MGERGNLLLERTRERNRKSAGKGSVESGGMGAVIEVGLPVLIILAMTIVGLELTPADLNRVLHYPVQVAASLVGQVLLLPLIAAALIVLLRPEPAVTGGLILAAAAPQAMSSNFFCLLGRANLALSVTLTAASSVLALASTPLVAKLGFDLLLDEQAGFSLPVDKVMQQVLTGLLLPVGAGMLVRHYAPAFVERNHQRLQRLSLAAVVAMLATISGGPGCDHRAQPRVASCWPRLLFTGGRSSAGLRHRQGILVAQSRQRLQCSRRFLRAA